jgi:ABC-type dipeptide/oligopeptide/nickel transport system permease subunit
VYSSPIACGRFDSAVQARENRRRTMADPRSFERFQRSRGGILGLCLVVFVSLTALLGPFVAPYPPDEQFREGLRENGIPRGPDAHFWLGTDSLGRDELSRLLHGGQVSLEVALTATAVALALGLGVGLSAGYTGGVLDSVTMRATDMLLSLPFLLVAVAVNRAVPRAGVTSLCLLLGLLSWPTMARVTRAKVRSVREREFVEAARALGASTPRILLRHVLPNVLGPALVLATTMVAEMIVAESAMSFLGLGVSPPEATWGSMLYEGRDMLGHAPRLLAVPALLIAATVFGFNLLGEGLRDALDPRS